MSERGTTVGAFGALLVSVVYAGHWPGVSDTVPAWACVPLWGAAVVAALLMIAARRRDAELLSGLVLVMGTLVVVQVATVWLWERPW